MRLPVLLAVAALATAGCLDGPAGTPGDSSKATITGVTYVSVPAGAAAGSTAVVCWRVEGSGSIPHTAIHTDSEARGGTSHTAYFGTTYYPGNASAAVSVALPATSCTGIRMPATPGGKVFLVAHATDGTVHRYASGERSIAVSNATGPGIASVTVTAFPRDWAEANTTAVVCWRVEGSGSVPHTAIHWDTQPHPGDASFQDYVKAPRYPDNATTQAPAGYPIPATFCTGIPLPIDARRVYFRAHALETGAGVLSDEAEIAVVGRVSRIVLDPPPPVAGARSDVVVCWRLEGYGTIPHTAIHTANESHPGATDFSVYAGPTYYPDNATSATPKSVPNRFCTGVRMPASGERIYLVAHAIDVRKPPGVLSSEATILALV